MLKTFEVTIDTEEFGRDYSDKELEEFIADRMSLFWEKALVGGRLMACVVCESEMKLDTLITHLNDKLILAYNLLLAQEKEITKLKAD